MARKTVRFGVNGASAVMKLNEILDAPLYHNSEHIIKHIDGQQHLDVHNNGILGAGFEATVIEDPSSVGVLKLLSTRDLPINKNPYAMYANMCRRFSKSNPYLPKVVSIRKQNPSRAEWHQYLNQLNIDQDDTNARRAEVYVFEMERLHPFHHIDTHQAIALYERVLKVVPEDLSRQDMLEHIQEEVEGLCQIPHLKSKTDSLLKQACAMIHSISYKLDVEIDISLSNLMVRPTVGGLQLVITDPLIH
jgi:hypothetical protein